MDNSPLGRLPPELRNYVYELCLKQPGTIHIFRCRPKNDSFGGPLRLLPDEFVMEAQLRPKDPPDKTHTCKPLPRHAFALAQTCKGVHAECGSMIYSCNTFNIYLYRFRLPSSGPDELTYDMYNPNIHDIEDVVHNPPSSPQKVEEMLTAWHLFKERIGQQNADALQSVVLELGMDRIRWTATAQPTLGGGILAALTKEVKLTKGLQMEVKMFIDAFDGDRTRVMIDLDRTVDSLGNLAVEYENESADERTHVVRASVLRQLSGAFQGWAKEADVEAGDGDGPELVGTVANA